MFYRQKVNQEFSQQFLTLFQHWEIDVQKAEEQEEKLANLFQQQQKVFQLNLELFRARD